MDFVTGFEAEVWFRLTCQRLRMLDPNPPTLSMLEPVFRRELSEFCVNQALKNVFALIQTLNTQNSEHSLPQASFKKD
jgi:hypothetical protein